MNSLSALVKQVKRFFDDGYSQRLPPPISFPIITSEFYVAPWVNYVQVFQKEPSILPSEDFPYTQDLIFLAFFMDPSRKMQQELSINEIKQVNELNLPLCFEYIKGPNHYCKACVVADTRPFQSILLLSCAIKTYHYASDLFISAFQNVKPNAPPSQMGLESASNGFIKCLAFMSKYEKLVAKIPNFSNDELILPATLKLMDGFCKMGIHICEHFLLPTLNFLPVPLARCIRIAQTVRETSTEKVDVNLLIKNLISLIINWCYDVLAHKKPMIEPFQDVDEMCLDSAILVHIEKRDITEIVSEKAGIFTNALNNFTDKELPDSNLNIRVQNEVERINNYINTISWKKHDR